MMHRISIALATYNGAKYLREQLDSLAKQTLLPAELVVGDDGSADGTLAILEDFARRSPFPVHVTRNPARLGYRGNFMAAALRCQSQLIAFCDQDDVWHPDKCATLIACFDDPDCLLAYHNAILTDRQGVPLKPFYDNPPQLASAPPMSLPPWHFAHGYALMFRRELLDAAARAQYVPDAYHRGETMGHDLLLFVMAGTLGRVVYVDKPLVWYRQHETQTVGMRGLARETWLSRWRARLEDRREVYLHFAQVAQGIAVSLERLGAGGHFERATEGARSWSALASLYTDRAAACSAPSFGARLAAYRRLCQQGAYGKTGFWTFGSRAAVKDAVLGVMFAALVQRYGRPGGADISCHRGEATVALA
jgi:hypothetical protein